MENMNFYAIKVGRITRSGNMDALYSFVCAAKTANRNDVFNHFTKKYTGLSIYCDKIEEIITEEVERSISEFGICEKPEITELKTKIKELELREKETQVIIDDIHRSKFPEDAVKLTSELKSIKDDYDNKIEEIHTVMENFILKHYSPFAESVSFPEKYSENNSRFKFKLTLEGKLKREFL